METIYLEKFLLSLGHIPLELQKYCSLKSLPAGQVEGIWAPSRKITTVDKNAPIILNQSVHNTT